MHICYNLCYCSWVTVTGTFPTVNKMSEYTFGGVALFPICIFRGGALIKFLATPVGNKRGDGGICQSHSQDLVSFDFPRQPGSPAVTWHPLSASVPLQPGCSLHEVPSAFHSDLMVYISSTCFSLSIKASCQVPVKSREPWDGFCGSLVTSGC